MFDQVVPLKAEAVLKKWSIRDIMPPSASSGLLFHPPDGCDPPTTSKKFVNKLNPSVANSFSLLGGFLLFVTADGLPVTALPAPPGDSSFNSAMIFILAL